MNVWPHQSTAEMSAFYGNPDTDHNGVPDRAWEDLHLVGIVPPYAMYLAWAPAQPVKTIRVNRKCSDSLSRVLAAIKAHYGTAEAIAAARVDLYGGCYNFRLKRGGSTLSNHSWGSAIDLDPAHNGFGDHNPKMDRAVVALFAAEGWTWGGQWSTPDGMHFQAANL